MEGQDWSAQHPLGDAFVSSHGPALATFGNSAMIAFKGDGGDRQLYFSLFDGRSWSPPAIFSWGGSSHAPAIAGSGRDNVYAAWKGAGDDPRLFWARFHEGPWSSQQEVAGGAFGTSDHPALAWFGDHAVMAWKGKGDDQRLFWSALRGDQWSAQTVVSDGAVGSSTAPALAHINDRLILAWKGTGPDPRIFLASYDGNSWSPQQDFLGGGAQAPAHGVVVLRRLEPVGRSLSKPRPPTSAAAGVAEAAVPTSLSTPARLGLLSVVPVLFPPRSVETTEHAIDHLELADRRRVMGVDLRRLQIIRGDARVASQLNEAPAERTGHGVAAAQDVGVQLFERQPDGVQTADGVHSNRAVAGSDETALQRDLTTNRTDATLWTPKRTPHRRTVI